MLARLALATFIPVLCCAQDFTNFHIEKIATGFQFTEGPVWSRDGYLIFSDIPANKIIRMIPPPTLQDKAKVAVWRENSGGANGNALDVQGRLYTCEGHAHRVTRTDKRGKVEVLAADWQGKRFNAPSAIIVRHDGHIYFSDPAFGSANDSRELDFYGVFHLTPKGELSLVAKWKTRPNGVALSPDGGTLFVADSDLQTVHTFDLDRAGAAAKERLFITNIDGVPNGLRTDEKGNLYVAANGIEVYSPAGKFLGEIPVESPSNCAFGDADFTTLYITARSAIYRTNLGVKGSVQY